MNKRTLTGALVILTFAAMFAAAVPQQQDKPLSGVFIDRMQDPTIDYAHQATADPVYQLQQKIAAGKATLRNDRTSGYLRSLLEALDVSVSSQIAVFAKDSAQRSRITPQNPRTIFFNDDVAIGWVRGGYIEIAAQDARQAVIFYTVDPTSDGRLSFRRRGDDCLICHYNYSTSGIPGMIVRSSGQYSVDHTVPIEKRWGGWYVTGQLGAIRHLGNIGSDVLPLTAQTTDNLNWMSFDRKFDATGYLTAHSDVIALMVFEHQMHMMNLLSRIGWEARVAQRQGKRLAKDEAPIPLDAASREVVDYMLFIGEAPIRGKIQGSTPYAEQFEARGPRDRKGRSLRDLQRDGRLMRYPCSYMIYSAQFDSLPSQAKSAIYRRLWRILAGQDNSSKYSRLTRSDRVAITEILKDTKKDLPEYLQPALIR
jgi:hypothetical protein